MLSQILKAYNNEIYSLSVMSIFLHYTQHYTANTGNFVDKP